MIEPLSTQKQLFHDFPFGDTFEDMPFLEIHI